MEAGVYYQAELFRRDYRNGDAIAERYLALLNSSDYLSSSGRQVFRGAPNLLDRKIPKSRFSKVSKALEIYPQGENLTSRELSYKLKRMGYDWDAKLKSWQKFSR